MFSSLGTRKVEKLGVTVTLSLIEEVSDDFFRESFEQVVSIFTENILFLHLESQRLIFTNVSLIVCGVKSKPL